MKDKKDNYDIVAQELLKHLDTSSKCFMLNLQAALAILSLQDKIQYLQNEQNKDVMFVYDTVNC